MALHFWAMLIACLAQLSHGQLLHAGEDCYAACFKQPGFCDWCGLGMACCQKDLVTDPKECQYDLAWKAEGHHECIKPTYKPGETPPAQTSVAAGASVSAGGGPGTSGIEAGAKSGGGGPGTSGIEAGAKSGIPQGGKSSSTSGGGPGTSGIEAGARSAAPVGAKPSSTTEKPASSETAGKLSSTEATTSGGVKHQVSSTVSTTKKIDDDDGFFAMPEPQPEKKILTTTTPTPMIHSAGASKASGAPPDISSLGGPSALAAPAGAAPAPEPATQAPAVAAPVPVPPAPAPAVAAPVPATAVAASVPQGACPNLFPYPGGLDKKLCFKTQMQAGAGKGPCDSWCTLDDDYGSPGCGLIFNKLCSKVGTAAAAPPAPPQATVRTVHHGVTDEDDEEEDDDDAEDALLKALKQQGQSSDSESSDSDTDDVVAALKGLTGNALGSDTGVAATTTQAPTAAPTTAAIVATTPAPAPVPAESNVFSGAAPDLAAMGIAPPPTPAPPPPPTPPPAPAPLPAAGNPPAISARVASNTAGTAGTAGAGSTTSTNNKKKSSSAASSGSSGGKGWIWFLVTLLICCCCCAGGGGLLYMTKMKKTKQRGAQLSNYDYERQPVYQQVPPMDPGFRASSMGESMPKITPTPPPMTEQTQFMSNLMPTDSIPSQTPWSAMSQPQTMPLQAPIVQEVVAQPVAPSTQLTGAMPYGMQAQAPTAASAGPVTFPGMPSIGASHYTSVQTATVPQTNYNLGQTVAAPSSAATAAYTSSAYATVPTTSAVAAPMAASMQLGTTTTVPPTQPQGLTMQVQNGQATYVAAPRYM